MSIVLCVEFELEWNGFVANIEYEVKTSNNLIKPDDPCLVKNGGCDEYYGYCSSDAFGKVTCTCKDGLNLLQDGSCKDINECEEGHECTDNKRCSNMFQSYECYCKDEFQNAYGECKDNICHVNNGGCHENADCMAEDYDNATCICFEGYEGDGLSCKDVNECYDYPCGDMAICLNEPGTYNCICNDGFTKDGNQCIDDDECEWETCSENRTCVNIPGTYVCECNSGFKISKGICLDHDECTDPDICPENEVCQNVVGGYNCKCKRGFVMYARKCSEELPLIWFEEKYAAPFIFENITELMKVTRDSSSLTGSEQKLKNYSGLSDSKITALREKNPGDLYKYLAYAGFLVTRGYFSEEELRGKITNYSEFRKTFTTELMANYGLDDNYLNAMREIDLINLFAFKDEVNFPGFELKYVLPLVWLNSTENAELMSETEIRNVSEQKLKEYTGWDDETLASLDSEELARNLAMTGFLVSREIFTSENLSERIGNHEDLRNTFIHELNVAYGDDISKLQGMAEVDLVNEFAYKDWYATKSVEV